MVDEIANESVAAEKKVEKVEKEKTTASTDKISAEIADEIGKISGAPTASLSSSLLPSGQQVAVTLIDLSDKNRGEVHYNDSTQWTSASTYKLFVAADENQAVERGDLAWSSRLNGTTLSNCLYQMIHVSDNACPEAWLQTYSGFSDLTTLGQKYGGAQTEFAVDNMRTSASNLANLLANLARGKLMNTDNTNNLLTLMENQPYRDGIPAGVAKNGVATSVADKVGFVNDYNGPILNDAAIVNSPQGNYILVIMTNGYSWQFISDLAQWIDAQME